jgi:hypothetical protein
VSDTTPTNPEHEGIAQAFHETYERLAPDFGYKTREASAVEWPDVPENNRGLMIAVVTDLVNRGVIRLAEADTHQWIAKHDVERYLDESITHWRAVADGETPGHADPEKAPAVQEQAPLYVDAFQSARVSLIGELLPAPPEIQS